MCQKYEKDIVIMLTIFIIVGSNLKLFLKCDKIWKNCAIGYINIFSNASNSLEL